MTRTTTAANDATTIAVEDAGSFSGGKGLVEADLVQLEGQSVALLVTAVDYDANTLTIAAPASWEAGTGVSLPYFGAAPDQGFYAAGLLAELLRYRSTDQSCGSDDQIHGLLRFEACHCPSGSGKWIPLNEGVGRA